MKIHPPHSNESNRITHAEKGKEKVKGGIMSEDIGGFLLFPKNVPKNYLKLS